MTPGIKSLGDFQISTAAVLMGSPVSDLDTLDKVTIDVHFQYGNGGSSVSVIVQTSLNQGTTWIDIARFDFTTVGDERVATLTRDFLAYPYLVGSLFSESVVNGVLGDRLRTVVTSTGTYTNSTVLSVRAMVT